MPLKTTDAALTRHVRKAGCASKIGQADLLRVLGRLPPVTDPNVLLGTAAGDDAGIYRLDERHALVQTVDVFTPCVDDAFLFGQIAAANSVSDVYAMGGRPVTALSIVGFPIDDLDDRFLENMLRGGMEKLAEAGCSLIGGHSINDDEIKLGFAVTGLIHPGKAVQRDRAREGDALVLTKPLGTGMVAFGAQIGRIRPECLDEVGAVMATLNRDAAELMVAHGAHACTDVTGFGLAGHLVEMARRSGVVAEIDLPGLPVFGAVAQCLENDILGGAIERNQDYAMAWVRVEAGGGEKSLPILYDAQTSGGLLISLPEKEARALVDALRRRGHEAASIIGRITAPRPGDPDGLVIVTGRGLENFIGRRDVAVLPAAAAPEGAGDARPGAKEVEMSCCSPESVEPQGVPSPGSCCPSPPGADSGGQDAASTRNLFTDYMKAANRAGRVDGRTKKLIAIALSIVQHCEPCLRSHLKSALEMGITRVEIEEVANLAVEFAGCPALMFYREVCKELNP